MITFNPKVVPVLQAKLREVDQRQAARNELTAPLAQAQAAAGRLQAQMAGLSKQHAEQGAGMPQADTNRLPQLLAGDAVPPIDKVAEARRAKFQSFEAQRTQIRSDLDTVTRHVAQLRAQAQAADQQVTAAYADFLEELGEAVLEAYQAAARQFVSAFVPAIYSAALRHRQIAGQSDPAWFRRVMPLATIQWAEREPVQDSPHHAPRYPIVGLWPRGDMKLVSGEPVESDAVIDAIIAQIRASGAPAGDVTQSHAA